MAKLLYAILFTLIFTGIRTTYSVVMIFTRIREFANPPIGLRVGFTFIPELISVFSFVGVGFLTKDIRRKVKEKEAITLSSRSQSSGPLRTGENGTWTEE